MACNVTSDVMLMRAVLGADNLFLRDGDAEEVGHGG